MNKTFIGILAAALLVIGGVLWYTVHANQEHLLTLKGAVLKVRTLPLEPSATLVIVDFRVTNPSAAGFSVQDVELEMDPKSSDTKGDAKAAAKPIPGSVIESRELARIFEYEPKVGPKEHERISSGDSISAGKTKEFMIAARFEATPSDVDARARFRIRLHDFNGPIFEIVETEKAETQRQH